MDWRDAEIGASVGDGWVPLVDRLHALVLGIEPRVKVAQVKEKFGGLRYYYGLPADCGQDERLRIEVLVAGAEAASYWICEDCGRPGAWADADDGYWTKTLCEDHHAERREKRARPAQ